MKYGSPTALHKQLFIIVLLYYILQHIFKKIYELNLIYIDSLLAFHLSAKFSTFKWKLGGVPLITENFRLHFRNQRLKTYKSLNEI